MTVAHGEDDTARFTSIYRRNHTRVLGYALAHSRREVAEDIANETFLTAWRKLDEVPRDDPLPSVADVLAEARRRHIGGIGYRYQPTSPDEQGNRQPYPMGIPADKVKGDWTVYDAVAGTGGQVLLFVHPAG